jgi:hypothetical protein
MARWGLGLRYRTRLFRGEVDGVTLGDADFRKSYIKNGGSS